MPATMFPLEFYLGHTDEFEPDSDYVNGEIEPPPMGELDHATWQMAIQQWFDRHRTEWNIRTIRLVEPKSGAISRFEHGKLVPVVDTIEQLPDSSCSIDWAQVSELMDC
jgi:hypothetical protein